MSYAERLVIDAETQSTVLYDEHMVRYSFVAPLAQGKRVLDIACGSGYGSAFLALNAQSVVGIDLDPEAVAMAQKAYAHEKIHFQVGDATALQLADNSIDFVTSFETIEHLPNIKAYLQELVRVSTKEALVCISTPNKVVFGQKNPFHLKEFTREEFEAVLREHFSVVRIFEQKNGLSSFISSGKGNNNGTISVVDSGGAPRYFIAICSQTDFSLNLDAVSSVNVVALERWEHNPGWRLVNGVYAFLQKLKLVK